MTVAGIDVSTRAIDLVLLDLDTDRAEWARYELTGGDLVERVRSIKDWRVPWTLGATLGRDNAHVWDDVVAIGIERPAGKHGVAQVSMAFGAALICLPKETLVQPWQPAEWRKACGMKGNATKQDVAGWAWDARSDAAAISVADWPQDACDAYCIAYATRSVLETVERQAA